MKSRTLTCITAMTLFAALAIPVSLAADDDDGDHHHKHHHYQLIDLGTFGGPESYLAGSNGVTSPGAVNQVLNNRGTVVGWGDTATVDPFAPNCFMNFPPDCFLALPFQWQKGVLTDLDVLPGGAASNAVWISDNGLIAGVSENGLVDPLRPGFPEFRAVLWKDGEITDLGTLGGNYSSALSVNNRGQVVGGAMNAILDPFDPLFATQPRAFLWQDGAMQDLGTLGGSEATALFVNQRGQVAGFSFTNSSPNSVADICGTGVPTTDPFLWEDGRMIDLGTLGGTCGLPFSLNNRGQVVGLSDLAGDLTSHPFLWHRGTMKDLGTLGGSFGIAQGINDAGEVVGAANNKNDQAFLAFLWKDDVMTNLGTLNGDDCSQAFHINSKGQIVGNSFPCAGGRSHAFLWENGSMTDLNALLPPGSSLTPWGDGAFINDRGEIAGVRVLPDGDLHAVLLIPCDEHHAGVEGCDYDPVDAPAAIPETSPAVRDASSRTLPQSLMHRMNRYRLPGPAFGPRN
jgi:probable HAF family extracellular repeat protein